MVPDSICSVNFGGKTFLPESICMKNYKMPEFYMIGLISPKNIFPIFRGGGDMCPSYFPSATPMILTCILLILLLLTLLLLGLLLQGHREFPFGNSRESATSKIPGGNSREFLNFWRKILTVHKISKFSYFLL